jgi:hypothetical protein
MTAIPYEKGPKFPRGRKLAAVTINTSDQNLYSICVWYLSAFLLLMVFDLREFGAYWCLLTIVVFATSSTQVHERQGIRIILTKLETA